MHIFCYCKIIFLGDQILLQIHCWFHNGVISLGISSSRYGFGWRSGNIVIWLQRMRRTTYQYISLNLYLVDTAKNNSIAQLCCIFLIRVHWIIKLIDGWFINWYRKTVLTASFESIAQRSDTPRHRWQLPLRKKLCIPKIPVKLTRKLHPNLPCRHPEQAHQAGWPAGATTRRTSSRTRCSRSGAAVARRAFAVPLVLASSSLAAITRTTAIAISGRLCPRWPYPRPPGPPIARSIPSKEVATYL